MKNLRLRSLSIAFLLLVLVASTETISPAAVSSASKAMSFMTASVGGGWYPVGVAIADLWNKSIPGSNVVVTTGGGAANVIGVDSGQAQVAIAMGIQAVDGMKGSEPFKEKTSHVRSMATLYSQKIEFFASKDANVRSFMDLKGKRVNVCPKAHASHQLSRMACEVHGMTFEDFAQAQLLDKNEAVGLFKDGHLDALLFSGEMPDPAILEAAQGRSISLIEIAQDKLEAMRERNSGLLPATIPANTYPGQDKDFQTLAVPLMIIVRDDVPDDVVYNLTKTFAENLEQLGKAQAALREISDPADLAADLGVPFHPGALKYYKEKGYIK